MCFNPPTATYIKLKHYLLHISLTTYFRSIIVLYFLLLKKKYRYKVVSLRFVQFTLEITFFFLFFLPCCKKEADTKVTLQTHTYSTLIILHLIYLLNKKNIIILLRLPILLMLLLLYQARYLMFQ